MKISEFCGKFDITPETVRFYVNKGLLCPVSKNNRYIFQENDIDDMQKILKLKSYRFSIEDIHQLLSIWRLSRFDSAEELNDYVKILENQRSFLLTEEKHLAEAISSIEYDVHHVTGRHKSSSKNRFGVPLIFLDFLACPLCHSNLDLIDCNIAEGQVLNGRLTCRCGYNAKIQNGIIVGPVGNISNYDWPDTERNCYRLMNPTLASYMQRAYHWMLDKLGGQNISGKTVLEDYINNYCFCHANLESLDENALYIITDKHLEMVSVYKELIDKIRTKHRILYIAASSNMLPLKEKCIDYYIDFDSDNEHSLYEHEYSTDEILKYLNTTCVGIGAFFSFKPKSESIRVLHREYPEVWDRGFDLSYFKRYLSATWNNIIEEESIGTVVEKVRDEKAIFYHVPGEVGMDVWFAKNPNTVQEKMMPTH